MVTLKEILHGGFVSHQFAEEQRTEEAIADIVQLFNRAALALNRYGVGESEQVYTLWIPARIEFLGKHTDYAGGVSLLAALRKGFAFIVHVHQNDQVHVLDAGSMQKVQVDLKNLRFKASYPWGVYVQTVIQRVTANFGRLPGGATISMASNVPAAAGMSSSSALITGLFLSMREAFSLDQTEAYRTHIHTSLDLADYLGHIENGQTYKGLVGAKGVGTFGGSQDHTAIMCSKRGTLRLFSFRPTNMLDEVALPEKHVFVIGCSGVRAEKTRSALEQYNRCARLVQHILECPEVNPDSQFTSLSELIAQPGFTFSAAEQSLRICGNGQELGRRLYQFVQETQEIIPGVVTALRNKDLARVGQLVEQSHQLADTHLGNQVPETNYLVKTAIAEGAIASSAFGAGFGGSVWALVEESAAEKFMQSWKKAYLKAYPQWQSNASFFIETTGDRCRVLGKD